MESLVDYGSSEGETDDVIENSNVTKTLPEQTPTVLSQPVRCFEHVDGVWASSVQFQGQNSGSRMPLTSASSMP
jgi:hypothetical protein